MTNKQQNDEAETITLIGLCTVLGISLFTIFGIIPFIIKLFDEKFFTKSMSDGFITVSYISLLFLLPVISTFATKIYKKYNFKFPIFENLKFMKKINFNVLKDIALGNKKAMIGIFIFTIIFGGILKCCTSSYHLKYSVNELFSKRPEYEQFYFCSGFLYGRFEHLGNKLNEDIRYQLIKVKTTAMSFGQASILYNRHANNSDITLFNDGKYAYFHLDRDSIQQKCEKVLTLGNKITNVGPDDLILLGERELSSIKFETDSQSLPAQPVPSQPEPRVIGKNGFIATVTCSFNGNNGSLLPCLERTDIKVRSGNFSNVYTGLDLLNARGQISLPQHFALVTRNSHDTFILTVSIRDKNTNEEVFRDSAGRWGTISIAN